MALERDWTKQRYITQPPTCERPGGTSIMAKVWLYCYLMIVQLPPESGQPHPVWKPSQYDDA